MYWLKIRFVAHASPTVQYGNESFFFEIKPQVNLRKWTTKNLFPSCSIWDVLTLTAHKIPLKLNFSDISPLPHKHKSLATEREIIAESAIPSSLIKDLWNLRIYLWTKPLIEATLLQYLAFEVIPGSSDGLAYGYRQHKLWLEIVTE